MDYDKYLATRKPLRTIKRVTMLMESQPVFQHSPKNPPMVRSNGGLRGSLATSIRENIK